MNKLFTKIAALALGATMAVGVGVAVASSGKEATPVHAANGSVTLNTTFFDLSGTTYTTKSATDSTSGVTFNVKDCNVNSGLNMKKSTGEIYNSTAFSNKKITSVVLDGIKFSSASSAGFYVYGGTSSKPSNLLHENSGSTTKTTVDFSSNNYTYFYIKNKGTRTTAFSSVVINYTDAANDYVGSLSVSPSTWTGYDSQTLSVSSFTVSGSKNGTAGAVTSSDYEYKGIGYMSGDNFVARDASFSSGNPTTADTRLAWKAKYPTTSGGSTYAWAYVTLTVSADSVNSISISGSMTKTTYNQGDAWDPTGFTVKAYYASAPSTPVDVTNNAGLSWSYNPATTASTSTTSVTCTASFGGKSDTSSAQSVTVNEKRNLGGLTEGRFFLIVGGHVLKASTFAAKGADTYTTDDDSVDGLLESDAWYFTSTGVQDQWTIRVSDAANANYLYATNTNNGLVSGGTSDSWTVEEGTGTYASKLVMKDTTNSRYISYTTSSGSYIRVYANTNNGDCAVSFVPYEEPVTLDSLTISGATSTFTAGDYFSLGSPTITATYSTGDESIAANDSGLSFKLGGNAITTSTRLTSSDNGKSLVVRYTDSENRYADATGYTLTVNPKPVQSVTLDKESATIAKGGTVQLTATVSDEYAIQTVNWTTSNSSIATVSAATSTSGNAITVTGSSSNTGSATITAYVDENDNGSLDSGEKSATCAITVSGDPVLNMLDEEENVISGESLHVFTTDSNIYLHVDAENFVGAITYTWSSSNTSAIAILEEADEMCEFDIVGAGTNVRLSCHAVGATSGNLTTYVDYTVTEPQVDEVTWSAPATLSVYDNASLTAANITSWSPAYHKDNGESGSISSGYTVKLGGTTISLSYPWDVEDDGEELWIEYGGIASSHVTVQVTEHLNAISYSSWSLVTDVSDLSAGDVIIIANADKGEAMSSTALKAGETLEVTDVTIADGEVTSEVPSATAKFTLGGNSSDGWSFKCGDNYLYFDTATNKRTMDLKESSSSYNITIDGETGDAIIGDTMRVVLNTAASPHRWSSYNTTTETATMNFAEIYKASNSNIADTNATAQRALLGYVATFNSTMNCDDGGATENVESKWSTLAVTFTDTMNGLESGDKTVFKRLVANASAVEGGDSLQDFLARYDYIIAKYKISNDFLHTGADRGAVQYAYVNPITIIGNKSDVNVIAIVVITSVVSLTAIGGYFFLRKRKENI